MVENKILPIPCGECSFVGALHDCGLCELHCCKCGGPNIELVAVMAASAAQVAARKLLTGEKLVDEFSLRLTLAAISPNDCILIANALEVVEPDEAGNEERARDLAIIFRCAATGDRPGDPHDFGEYCECRDCTGPGMVDARAEAETCGSCTTTRNLARCECGCGRRYCTRDTPATFLNPPELSCFRQHELSNTELVDESQAETCDSCRSSGPHCPTHGRFRRMS
jgi:hypothetical protein